MSPLLINSSANMSNGIKANAIPHSTAVAAAKNRQKLEQSIKAQEPSIDKPEDEDDEDSREEERRATGRSIAIVVFLSLMCLALYHVIEKKTTVLAGVLVPAMILFTYLFFVIHVSQQDKKKRRKLLEESGADLEMSISSVDQKSKTPSSVPNPSISSVATLPSTSGVKSTSKIIDPRLIALRGANSHHPLTHKSSSSSLHQLGSSSTCSPASASVNSSSDKKKPFKKAQSQSHIQVVNNKSANVQPASAQIAIQHETKKLKKSRSFDKTNYLMDMQQPHKKSHVTESKRPKQSKSSVKA